MKQHFIDILPSKCSKFLSISILKIWVEKTTTHKQFLLICAEGTVLLIPTEKVKKPNDCVVKSKHTRLKETRWPNGHDR